MPEQAFKNVIEEVTRGEILLYLKEVYPEGATPLTLRHYLQSERLISVDEKRLAFHIHYLAESGLVTYEARPKRSFDPEIIRLVKITKNGIDRVEGRPLDDSGVRL